MNSPLFAALKHGAVVAGHIILSVFLTGIAIALTDPKVVDLFATYVSKFGVPIAIVNVIVAIVLRFINTQNTIPADVTDGIVPPNVQ